MTPKEKLQEVAERLMTEGRVNEGSALDEAEEEMDRLEHALRRAEPYLVARLKTVKSAVGIKFDAEVVARVEGDLGAVRAALGQQ